MVLFLTQLAGVHITDNNVYVDVKLPIQHADVVLSSDVSLANRWVNIALEAAAAHRFGTA